MQEFNVSLRLHVNKSILFPIMVREGWEVQALMPTSKSTTDTVHENIDMRITN